MTPDSRRTHIIPIGAWVTSLVILLSMFLLMYWLVPWDSGVPQLVRILIPILPPFALAGWTLVLGYVYGDARRRGMRYVMWTLLAIFLFNGIGVILYFILREPLLAYCSRCGAGVQPSHAFCPRCGAGVQPACPACHRTVQSGWTHCAWCGNQL